MSNSEIEFPWVNYGAKDPDRENKMDELLNKPWSPFNGYDMVDVFIFCMSYAAGKNKTPLPPPKGQDSIPPHKFKEDTRQLMRMLAISKTNDLKIIKKSKGTDGYVKICEEYASAGFDEVYNRIKGGGTKYESPLDILYEMLNEIAQENN